MAAFPWLRSNETRGLSDATRAGLEREYLGAKSHALWKELCRRLGRVATTEEKLRFAAKIYSEQPAYGSHWGDQTLLDQMIFDIIGLDVRGTTEKMRKRGLEEEAIAANRQRVQRELAFRKIHGPDVLFIDTPPTRRPIRRDGQESGPEHGPRFLLTPGFEFGRILSRIDPKPGELLVDLGAADGAPGVQIGITRPGVRYIGYEYDNIRLENGGKTAERLDLKDVSLVHQDMLEHDFRIPAADYYYAANPGTRELYIKILSDLKRNAVEHKKPFLFITAGVEDKMRLVDNESSWLREIHFTQEGEEDSYIRYFIFKPEFLAESSR
jgi:hypothetical protein